MSKRILVELTDEQYDALSKFANFRSLSKVNAIRTWCDMLIGFNRKITAIIFDNENVKYYTDTEGIHNCAGDDKTLKFGISVSYEKDKGVTTAGQFDKKL